MTSPSVLLKAWNLKPKKQLGQNFLSDPSSATMIVNRADIGPDDVVLEVGAGLGALTVPAARTASYVYAVETDRNLIDLLRAELLAAQIDNAEVIKEDILRLDIEAFLDERGIERKIVVMGNLPYNISSQVIVKLVHARHRVQKAVIMLQKELAERLMATPGNKTYGRITAMLNYCGDIRGLATLGAHLFHPKPNVDSQVIEIAFKDEPDFPARDEAFLYAVIKAAFGQRRKNLRNALAGSELHVPAELADQALLAADIDPKRRAETMDVREFVALSHSLADMGITVGDKREA